MSDLVVETVAAPEPTPAEEPGVSPLRLVILLAALAAVGVWQGWRLLVIILAVVLMIFLHELGHFVMARRAGMKVTEFFIGFGPRNPTGLTAPTALPRSTDVVADSP